MNMDWTYRGYLVDVTKDNVSAVHECPSCYALVAPDRQDGHEEWHALFDPSFRRDGKGK